MTEQLLRHYGLNDAFPDSWRTADPADSTDVFSTTEPDALGTGLLVSKVLYERGIIRTDSGAPAEYCLDSKTFDARAYIRNVHRKATQNDLIRGQDYLRSAIESKAGSLKSLVEDNFDRFVSSKRVIDHVNSQISDDFSKSTGKGDSRLDMVKKTLNDTSVRATQIFEPVIENHRKADSLRGTLAIIEQYSAHFELPTILLKCIEINDNDAFLKEYKRGLGMFGDIRKRSGNAGSTLEKRTTHLLQRAWSEVERIVRDRETYVWKRLETQKSVDNERTSKLANFLLELGVDRNPYFTAYSQQIVKVKKQSSVILETGRQRIEVMRRKLQNQSTSSQQDRLTALSTYVKSELSPSEPVPNIIQTQEVLTFWDTINQLVESLWLGPVDTVTQNWEIVQDMTNTRSVKLLPNGPNGISRRYHSFNEQERNIAVKEAEEAIELLCSHLTDFFVSKPISTLPSNGSSNTSQSTSGQPESDQKDSVEFSFLCEGVNSVAACSQLSTTMTKIMSGVTKLHGLKISSKTDEDLQKMVIVVRERFVRVICELWQSDSDDLPHLETWSRSSTGDGTDFAKAFFVVQKSIIHGVSRVMFRNELMPLPSQRLLGNVRQQFVKNVYQVINGLMTLSYSDAKSQQTSEAAQIDVEAKKLLTITNLNTIQSSTLLQLIQILESTFSISLTADLQKMQSMFKQYCQKLSSSFLAPRLAALETFIARDLRGINWQQMAFPQDISLWANECILECVTTHALLSIRAPTLLKSMLDEMMLHIFSTVQLSISQIKEFSTEGMLQLTLDLEFLSSQFGESLPEAATAKIDEIFTLLEAEGRHEQVGPRDKTTMKAILNRTKTRWAVQANVFRGPQLAAPTRR